MVKLCGVYRIELGNGWFYVGSSGDLKKRERQHSLDLKKGRHCNPQMQKCWNKYNIFNFQIVALCGLHEILLLEQVLLDRHHTHPKNVNVAPMASSSMRGRHHSEETKQRLRYTSKMQPRSAEWGARISASKKGRPCDEVTKQKISKTLAGGVLSLEHRQKVSDGLNAYYAVNDAKPVSDLARKRMAESGRNRAPISDVTRQRMSDRMVKHWAKVRMERLAMEAMGNGQKCS